MPTVSFVNENIMVEVKAGTTLQEAVEVAGSSFPFGCRMGSCGTCRCIVVKGGENLNPMTDEEQKLFETLTSVGRNERLGCQLVIQGDVQVRA